ncbi:hypothetical protein LLH23_10255 [bacterium]|nr:hypothetical protein [bacterium]
MYRLPSKCVDMVFADPPYNLQLRGELYRPNMTRVQGVHDVWDQFLDFKHYDLFTLEWLHACQHVLKDTGTIWVIGSYHSIYRVGSLMMDLGFWMLNDFVWIKANPTPNFRGVRFTNAHETLIWAKKSKDQTKYTFNHHAMKYLNQNKQARSDWTLPICSGGERLTAPDGTKLHSTQKPERLLERVLLASTRPGDVVLDPFFGTGTTGVVAKQLHRRWIGIERDKSYHQAAKRRMATTTPRLLADITALADLDRAKPRVSFAVLVSDGAVPVGAVLRHAKTGAEAVVLADGSIALGDAVGSIHKMGGAAVGAPASNGWVTWLVEGDDGEWHPLDEARQAYLKQ